MAEKDWIKLEEVTKPKSKVFVCDTRDFHCYSINDDLCYKQLKKTISVFKIEDSNLWSDTEIVGYLKSLKEASGGEGEWRCMTFNGDPAWIKYIRFVKYDGHYYVAYSHELDNLLNKNFHTPKNINPENYLDK